MRKLAKDKDNKNKNREYESYADVYDIREERRKVKKRRRTKRITGVLIVAVVCATGYLTRDYWVTPVGEFFEQSKYSIAKEGTTDQTGGFPIILEQSENNYITKIDDMVGVISDTHITYYNNKGVKQQSVQHLFASPVARECETKLCVYDLNGYNFSVYDKNGEVYSQETENAIILAEACDKYTAVVTQTDKYNSYLSIYNESGKDFFRWSTNQRILSVAFNNDRTGCIVSTFSASGGDFVSKVYCLEFDKTEEIFETENIPGIIYKVGYCESGDMWFLSDRQLYRVTSDGNVSYSYSFDEDLAAFDLDGNTAVLAFDTVGNNGTKLLIFGEDKIPNTFTTEKRIEKLKADNGVCYLTESGYAELNISGKVTASAEVEKNYADFVTIDNCVYFIGYDGVEKVTFK